MMNRRSGPIYVILLKRKKQMHDVRSYKETMIVVPVRQ